MILKYAVNIITHTDVRNLHNKISSSYLLWGSPLVILHLTAQNDGNKTF